MDARKESTLDHPLQWFDYMLNYEGVHVYIRDSKLHLIEQYDAYVGDDLSYKFYEPDGNGNYIKNHGSILDFLRNISKRNRFNSIELITHQSQLLTTTADRKKILTGHLNTLYRLLQVASRYEHGFILIRDIESIIRFIGNNYSDLNIDHKALHLLNTRPTSPTYKKSHAFGYKSDLFSSGFLKELPILLTKYGIVKNVSNLDFLELGYKYEQFFTSPDPKNMHFIIQFDIDNHEAAFILENLGKFFRNFNPTTIEASQSFHKKYADNRPHDKKHLKRRDLFTAKTNSKEKFSNANFIGTNIQLFIKKLESTSNRYMVKKVRKS